MSKEFLLIAFAIALSTTAFFIGAVLWLKNIRAQLTLSLQELVDEQSLTARHLNANLAKMKKRQDLFEQSLAALIKANTQLELELTDLTNQLEPDLNADEPLPMPASDRTVH